jgi:hypothetical protein
LAARFPYFRLSRLFRIGTAIRLSRRLDQRSTGKRLATRRLSNRRAQASRLIRIGSLLTGYACSGYPRATKRLAVHCMYSSLLPNATSPRGFHASMPQIEAMTVPKRNLTIRSKIMMLAIQILPSRVRGFQDASVRLTGFGRPIRRATRVPNAPPMVGSWLTRRD